ncbi:MAG TPA: S41 family peptidase [Candidatus Limnocylindria bacterium]|nr:S41 family peptidase [Candidatus Limnocylindria bacterium]
MSFPSPQPRLTSGVRARRALGYVVVAGLAFSAGALVVRPADPPAPGVLDEAADRIASDAARPVDRETLEKAAVEGMLDSLGDRWSTYYGPADFSAYNASLEGRYTGIGVWLRQRVDGAVLVASVQPGTPAADAGMQSGDEVLAVDGSLSQGQTIAEVARDLRGDPGTQVRLTVADVRGISRTVDLTRVAVTSDDVTVDRLPGGVLLVSVDAFTRGVGRQVRAALAADASSRPSQRAGVVLDLRANSGGLVDEAVEVAGAFLDGGVVVSYDRRGRDTRTLVAAPGGDVATPLVVLVDGGTASAAEIVAAAMQDRGRAVIVGSRTFGKGSVQEPATLSDGSAIELTVGQYVTPSGRMIDGVGIDPDVLVDATDPAVAERRALDVLTGLVASLPTAGRG